METPDQELIENILNLISNKSPEVESKLEELEKNFFILKVIPSNTKLSPEIYEPCAIIKYEDVLYVDTSSECWQSRIVKEKGITWKNFKSLTKALLTGSHVSKEVQEKRLKICHECPLFRWDDNKETASCGICGCKVGNKSMKLLDLTRYEEDDTYGCKHPEGSRWKENGV